MSDAFGDKRDPLVKAMERATVGDLCAEIERLRVALAQIRDDPSSPPWISTIASAALLKEIKSEPAPSTSD